MKRLKNYRSDFEQIKIWVFHIKIKHVTGVIGDSRWPKYHLNITQILPGYSYLVIWKHWSGMARASKLIPAGKWSY